MQLNEKNSTIKGPEIQPRARSLDPLKEAREGDQSPLHAKTRGLCRGGSRRSTLFGVLTGLRHGLAGVKAQVSFTIHQRELLMYANVTRGSVPNFKAPQMRMQHLNERWTGV